MDRAEGSTGCPCSFLMEVLASRGHPKPCLEHFDSGTIFITCPRQKGLESSCCLCLHSKEMRLRNSK